MSKFLNAAALALIAASPAFAEGDKLGLGREALPEEIAAWDVKIMPDGRGLPEGSGDVMTGEEKFLEHCAVCHGDFAEGLDNWPKLAGGEDTLNRKDPVKTVGSYWPYLSTVWDYVHRSMPFGQAQILTADDTYAITAYILYSNYIVEDDFVLSRDNFMDVAMPNADGFFADNREEIEYPEFSKEPCMENCKDSVEITMHATVLDVTPEDASDAPMEGGEAAPADEEPQADPGSTEAAAVEEEAAVEEPQADPGSVEAAAVAATAAGAEPDPALVEAGEKVFKKCKACHMVGDDAKNRVGPVLNGVIGRSAGTVPDFKYSKAMIAAGEGGMVWNAENLAAYLKDPKGFIPKNKMSFAGLKSDDDIAAVEAYLAAHP